MNKTIRIYDDATTYCSCCGQRKPCAEMGNVGEAINLCMECARAAVKALTPKRPVIEPAATSKATREVGAFFYDSRRPRRIGCGGQRGGGINRCSMRLLDFIGLLRNGTGKMSPEPARLMDMLRALLVPELANLRKQLEDTRRLATETQRARKEAEKELDELAGLPRRQVPADRMDPIVEERDRQRTRRESPIQPEVAAIRLEEANKAIRAAIDEGGWALRGPVELVRINGGSVS